MEEGTGREEWEMSSLSLGQQGVLATSNLTGEAAWGGCLFTLCGSPGSTVSVPQQLWSAALLQEIFLLGLGKDLTFLPFIKAKGKKRGNWAKFLMTTSSGARGRVDVFGKASKERGLLEVRACGPKTGTSQEPSCSRKKASNQTRKGAVVSTGSWGGTVQGRLGV